MPKTLNETQSLVHAKRNNQKDEPPGIEFTIFFSFFIMLRLVVVLQLRVPHNPRGFLIDDELLSHS